MILFLTLLAFQHSFSGLAALFLLQQLVQLSSSVSAIHLHFLPAVCLLQTARTILLQPALHLIISQVLLPVPQLLQLLHDFAGFDVFDTMAMRFGLIGVILRKKVHFFVGDGLTCGVVTILHRYTADPTLLITLYNAQKSSFLYIFQMSLLTLLVIQHNDSKMAYQYVNAGCKGNVKDDANLIVGKVKALKCRVAERQRLKGEAGNWYITRGASDLTYAACVSEGYPERTAFGLMQKIEALVQDKASNVEAAERKMKTVHKEVNTLCEKYKNSSVDKVKQVQMATDELKQELTTGVRKLIGNKENLEEINDKASLMKNYAKSFEKSATDLQQVMCWRKWRFFVLIGVVMVIVLLSAGIIIYFRTH